MLKEIRENPVWLRLVKKYTCKRGNGAENRSSRANLENMRSRIEKGKGLVNHAQQKKDESSQYQHRQG